jgi:hypothetical protein
MYPKYWETESWWLCPNCHNCLVSAGTECCTDTFLALQWCNTCEKFCDSGTWNFNVKHTASQGLKSLLLRFSQNGHSNYIHKYINYMHVQMWKFKGNLHCTDYRNLVNVSIL